MTRVSVVCAAAGAPVNVGIQLSHASIAAATVAALIRSRRSCTAIPDLLHAPRCLDALALSGTGVLPDAVVAELVDALA